MPRKPNDSSQTRLVLAAFAADSAAWRHGLSLSRETGLSSGTLYPLLRRLAQQNLLEAEWRAPEVPGRPPRHVYRLTAAGRALARARETDGRPASRLAAQPS
jgi:PadR family transcriptional regulator PadR